MRTAVCSGVTIARRARVELAACVREGADVASPAEALPGPRQQHHAEVVTTGELLRRGRERGRERKIHRVRCVGTVELQSSDPAVDLEPDRRVAHLDAASAPCSRPPASTPLRLISTSR